MRATFLRRTRAANFSPHARLRPVNLAMSTYDFWPERYVPRGNRTVSMLRPRSFLNAVEERKIRPGSAANPTKAHDDHSVRPRLDRIKYCRRALELIAPKVEREDDALLTAKIP